MTTQYKVSNVKLQDAFMETLFNVINNIDNISTKITTGDYLELMNDFKKLSSYKESLATNVYYTDMKRRYEKRQNNPRAYLGEAEKLDHKDYVNCIRCHKRVKGNYYNEHLNNTLMCYDKGQLKYTMIQDKKITHSNKMLGLEILLNKLLKNRFFKKGEEFNYNKLNINCDILNLSVRTSNGKKKYKANICDLMNNEVENRTNELRELNEMRNEDIDRGIILLPVKILPIKMKKNKLNKLNK